MIHIYFFLKKKTFFFSSATHNANNTKQKDRSAKKMSCKRIAFLDCWLFDVNDIAGLIFNFLNDVQLEYWITTTTQETDIEMLIHHVRVFHPDTLLYLMKTHSSRRLIEKADRKTDWDRLSRWFIFVVDAPMWWIQLHIHEIPPRQVTTVFGELDSDRARDIFNAFAIGSSWTEQEQADLFLNACYDDDHDAKDTINMITWIWDHCCLQDYTLVINLSDLCEEVLAFVLKRCTLEWDCASDSTDLPLTHVKLLETTWPLRMPTVLDALKSKNFDVAVYMWPKSDCDYFANFDALISKSYISQDEIQMPCPLSRQHQRDIVFGKYSCFNCEPFNDSDPPMFQRQQREFAELDFLVQCVVARLEPESSLHKDTIRWLDYCLQKHCCDAYFWQACKLKLSALVIFLWNNVDDTKHTTWSQYLSFCSSSCDETLLLFVKTQIPQFVMDNADVFVHKALQIDCVKGWAFYLPLLSPREVYRACQLSMDHNSWFFMTAWAYVEHRHANALFDLALTRRHRPIALFLLKQPELKLEHLGDRLPVFIEMRLSDAILRTPFYKHFSEAQVQWCATRALAKCDMETLCALYALLPLTKEQWRQLLPDFDLTKINLFFVKALLQYELVTGPELFALDQNRFLRILNVVHFDV